MTDLDSLVDTPPESEPEPEPEVLSPDKLGGLEVRPVTDQPTGQYINMLVYGPFGVGKTVLCGSASEVPEMSPVLFIDIEGGTFSLRKRYPGSQVVRVKTWKDMQKVYEGLYDQLQKGNCPYRTVVLDSLTEIQKFSMYGIMTEVVKKDSDRDFEVPSLREYLKNGEQTRLLVRAFRDLPIHTLFTALPRKERDQRTGKETTFPSLGGQLKQEIGGFVDIVVYYYRKRDPQLGDDQWHRLLLTTLTEDYVCKDRSDQLPEIVVDPTMRLLYDLIFTESETTRP